MDNKPSATSYRQYNAAGVNGTGAFDNVLQTNLQEYNLGVPPSIMNQTTRVNSMKVPHIRKKGSPLLGDISANTNNFDMMQMLNKLSKKIATEYQGP